MQNGTGRFAFYSGWKKKIGKAFVFFELDCYYETGELISGDGVSTANDISFG